MPDEKDRALDPELWVDEHGDYLYRYAMMKVRNPDLAEDLVQETLMAGIRGLERFSGKSSIRTWLVGILKHKIIDYLRTKYREQPLSDFEMEDKTYGQLFDEFDHWRQGLSSWKVDPLELANDGEFMRTLHECLSKLPERHAQAFQLRVLDDLTTDEVCKILNVTTTNLNVMLHRARLGLRECLEVNWFA